MSALFLGNSSGGFRGEFTGRSSVPPISHYSAGVAENCCEGKSLHSFAASFLPTLSIKLSILFSQLTELQAS